MKFWFECKEIFTKGTVVGTHSYYGVTRVRDPNRTTTMEIGYENVRKDKKGVSP